MASPLPLKNWVAGKDTPVWLAGELDGDFIKEPLNYWLIEVARACSPRDPVLSVCTVDECPTRATVREGLLLLPSRVVIAANDDTPITNRIIQSLGTQAKQHIRVLVADIPIADTFTPSTWPHDATDLNHLLTGRLNTEQCRQFRHPLRQRRSNVHRITLLRSPTCAFAYLLPGGPATVMENGARKRAYPSLIKPLPLRVSRFDPSWTVGRDQHQQVSHRQKQRVLVLGAGALGSPVVDHLAKAGVGFITLVDFDELSHANIGRHLLGAESIGQSKVEAVARQVNLGYPATVVTPRKMSAEHWLRNNSLSAVDLILDLTGEARVRWHVDQARQKYSCPLLIGWMEPYVAAAHVCMLPSGTPWMQGTQDLMRELEAVTWPEDVTRQEPGCSSTFQSYTAAAASHAIALVAERALKVIDGDHPVDIEPRPQIISWVRGQNFLDANYPNLKHRDWALPAKPYDGLLMERPFP